VEPGSTSLIVTEPIFNMSHAQECMEELVFEEFGFEGLIRVNGKIHLA
jgi:actin-related protein